MQKVQILSNAEVQERYPIDSYSNIGKLARESITHGYQIALVENEMFSSCDGMSMLYICKVAIEIEFPNRMVKIQNFVDVGQIRENKLIVSFEVI